jgi:hypothetical protein
VTQVALAGTRRLHPALPRLRASTLAAWGLPFALVLLLAFSGGGYDPLVRAETGIAVWWLVLVGVCTGIAGVRPGALGWAALGLLTLFGAWTLLGIGWTESQERTVAEVGRLATYLGLLALAVLAQGRAGSARCAVQGAAAAIGIVAIVAMLTRMYPQWGASADLYATFSTARNRLAFPLNYWNLLALLTVIGLPLVLACATSSRMLFTRALAAAAVPVMVLCVFLTISRGGVIAMAVALAVYLFITADRLQVFLTVLSTGAGAALLLVAADDRGALKAGMDTAATRSEGSELLVLTLIVCAGVALLQMAVGLAGRHARRPRVLTPGRRPTGAAFGVLLVAGVALFLAFGGPAQVSDRFDEFKNRTGDNASPGMSGLSRLDQSLSGNGRYQYWQSAQRAQESEPLRGIGAGTFEYWWARDGAISGGFVRDAHSLWFETLAETGFVGIGLLVSFFVLALLGGMIRTLREPDPVRRTALAGATAGIAAFATGASYEWAWEMPVLPALLFVLVAVVLVPKSGKPFVRVGDIASSGSANGRRGPRAAARPLRLAALGVALIATVAIVIPVAGVVNVRASQRLAADGNLPGALQRARDAEAAQPYGATTHLQQALVLEEAGALRPAVTQARMATADEPTNWRTWLTRSRLEARAGGATASLASYRKAKRLNPRSPLFAGAKG